MLYHAEAAYCFLFKLRKEKAAGRVVLQKEYLKSEGTDAEVLQTGIGMIPKVAHLRRLVNCIFLPNVQSIRIGSTAWLGSFSCFS